MRGFGYLKISSYFYCLYLLTTFIVQKDNQLLNWIVFYIASAVLFYFIQMALYKPKDEVSPSSTYIEFSIKSIKDIIGVSVFFLILNILILVSLQVLSYILSGEVTIDFRNVGHLVTNIMIFIVILLFSNFIYFKTYYLRKIHLETEVTQMKNEIRSEYSSDKIVMNVSNVDNVNDDGSDNVSNTKV